MERTCIARYSLHGVWTLTLVLVSSMAAIGLLMLLTNLLTCSKCLVISVASTMSMMACRSVRNWFLEERRTRISGKLQLDRWKTQHQCPNGCHRPVDVLKDIALAVAGSELEGERRVVALQHGRVVVKDRQLTAGVTQERIGSAWVVDVMHCGRYQRCHLVQLVQVALKRTQGGVSAAHTVQYTKLHPKI